MADSDVSDSNDSDQKDDPAILVHMRNQQLKNVIGGMPTIDLTGLERDSQVLVKKATKRLNRSFDGRSETIIEKFVGWHRRKKIDKIKTMLSSLFPKLKHSEDEVKSWVATVTERKEAALMVGKALLSDVEHQISLFQNHLEFLDEVINDVRQLDYDVVREISELRVALHFNQELMRKTRHSVAHVILEEKLDKAEDKIETIEVKTEKVSVDIRAEADVIDIDGGRLQTVDPNSVPEKDPFLPHAEPAIWHGVKGGSTTAANVIIASSPFTRSLGSPSQVVERKSLSDIQTKEKSRHSGQSRRNKGVESPVVWDGAESKRKSLLSCSVSLKALPIGDGHDAGDDHLHNCHLSKASTPTMHNAGDKSFFGLFHKQLSWSPSSVTNQGENVLRTSPSNIRTEKESSKKGNLPWGAMRRNSVDSIKCAQRPDATPIRARADSTSSATSSEASRISTADDHSLSSTSSAGSATASILAAKKRYKNGRMNSGLKLSSLLQILPDDQLSRQVVDGVDIDQEELTNRINKCLTLKEILKAILSTIQETQETETSSMRRMKKLRLELQSLLLDDTASVSSATSTQSLEALQAVSARPDVPATTAAGGSQLIYNMYAPVTERVVSLRRQSPPVMVGDDSQTIAQDLASIKSISSNESSPTMIPSGVDETPLTASSSSAVRSVPIVVLENNGFSLPVTASDGTHLLPVEPSLSLTMEHKRWSAETSYGSDGSHSPISTRYTAAKQNLKRMYYQHQSDGSHTALSESHDSLSIGSTSSVGVDTGFHEAATEFVDDLKAIVWEERSAKEKLAKISTLIDSASSIEGQLSATTSTR